MLCIAYLVIHYVIALFLIGPIHSDHVHILYFRAYAGKKDGCLYLQAFATFLQDQYLKKSLDRIYLMVKKVMIEAEQVRYYTLLFFRKFSEIE